MAKVVKCTPSLSIPILIVIPNYEEKHCCSLGFLMSVVWLVLALLKSRTVFPIKPVVSSDKRIFFSFPKENKCI